MRRLWRKIRAYTLLAIQAFIFQPIRRIRQLGRTGETRFLEAYGPDRLLPLGPEERARRDRWSGCIHCGLCDAACEVLGRVRRSEVPALSATPIGYSRSMSEYPFARISVAHLSTCADCNRCESVCPTGVPLREIVEDVCAHAERITAAGHGPEAAP
jgi:succinate dehydrogenase/fumarate reductase-like Fe-S protein